MLISVVAVLLALVGGVAVLVTRDGSNHPVQTRGKNKTGAEARTEPTTATTALSAPAPNRPPGTISPSAQAANPASPTAASPATPEQVAELLAGLPLQLEQAATSPDGQPRELTQEEVDKMIDDMLRQIGAKP